MLINAIDACRRDRCETGLIAVRVRGTTKLNELYGAEAVDNMLAEYAGRMLSITRGRSRVYRSRSVQFVVLSNDLDHEAFEQLTRHLTFSLLFKSQATPLLPSVLSYRPFTST